MKSFDDWFCELISNYVWYEPAKLHHEPDTFRHAANKVYMQYVASEQFPPIQEARKHVYNVLCKIPPDKKVGKDWSAKALAKLDEQKDKGADPNCPHCKGSGAVQVGENEYSTCPCIKEWIPLTGEERAKKLAEFKAIIDSMPLLNAFPRLSEKEKQEKDNTRPPVMPPYPVTTAEEAYVRDRHFEWIKNNFEARTGQKLPSWICEEDWNVLYDQKNLEKNGY